MIQKVCLKLDQFSPVYWDWQGMVATGFILNIHLYTSEELYPAEFPIPSNLHSTDTIGIIR